MTRLLLLLALALAGPVEAQTNADLDLDDAGRGEVVEGVAERLLARYVFPDVAEAMAADVRARAARGEYDGLTSARALADSLTAHLRGVSRDKHLGVSVSARPRPGVAERAAADAAQAGRDSFMVRYRNHGVDRVERLDGNVGYLALRGFAPADHGGTAEVLGAAFGVLARTDALVVDLRDNGGGDPATVQLLSSYLVGPEPVLLNTIYWRPDDETEAFWSLEALDGPRYGPERPVYVLTSDRSFSAAEGFAYELQALGRAVVVGETTGGGAHPGDLEWVTDRVRVWVPSGRAVNPVTGTNWEGVGVVPDVAVDEADALRVAHAAALRAIAAASATPEHRAEIERVLAGLEAAE